MLILHLPGFSRPAQQALEIDVSTSWTSLCACSSACRSSNLLQPCKRILSKPCWTSITTTALSAPMPSSNSIRQCKVPSEMSLLTSPQQLLKWCSGFTTSALPIKNRFPWNVSVQQIGLSEQRTRSTWASGDRSWKWRRLNKYNCGLSVGLIFVWPTPPSKVPQEL